MNAGSRGIARRCQMKCDSGIQQTYTNLNELNCASLKKENIPLAN